MPSERAADASGAVVYEITGMVCGNCETFVGEAIGELPGVLRVDVDAASGRASVTAEGEPDDAAVAAAVEELGYGFAGRARPPHPSAPRGAR
ncbi:heavy-metal-associated domain-containing protein [Streptomyces sp. NPDC048172]|uniref:heavy-metal-associated domain-containing protein n=1 Tax=Streptomyces sp. NPDC048172 TaxID=3365505 RepID=UPI0037103FB8